MIHQAKRKVFWQAAQMPQCREGAHVHYQELSRCRRVLYLVTYSTGTVEAQLTGLTVCSIACQPRDRSFPGAQMSDYWKCQLVKSSISLLAHEGSGGAGWKDGSEPEEANQWGDLDASVEAPSAQSAGILARMGIGRRLERLQHGWVREWSVLSV
ncbi:uncharacterized protein BDW70DRAFT_134999, partial [Aspergillus foveolatus]|uniref:uncharacterized protein n=1 Tax=Aspergillus foveolatus TaxID=210207 RepID=UPI003CCCD953